MDKNPPSKVLEIKINYKNLAGIERAKFDFYYLNFDKEIYDCLNKKRISFISYDFDVQYCNNDDDDLLCFIYIPSVKGCDENEVVYNMTHINVLKYDSNGLVREVFSGSAKFENPSLMFSDGYEKAFLDVLSTKKDTLSSWLKKFFN